MQHHFIDVDGLRLGYIEQNPAAKKALIFVHGNSSSSGTWRKQFESNFLQDYRLIAIDLPAHGSSQAAFNPTDDYSLVKLGYMLAKTIGAFVLNPNYILVGNSLGTNIIAEALKFGIISKGIVLGGPCVIDGKYTLESIVMPGVDTSAVFLDDVLDERVRKYASETSISKDEDDLNCFLKDYYQVKKPFRSSFSKALADGRYSDEINLLHEAAIPIALIFGAKDKIINPGYLDNAPFNIWNSQVYKIPNASHLVHIDQSLEFNGILEDYASDMFK